MAYSYGRGDRWRFMLEWLRLSSRVAARPVLLGAPAVANERKLALSVRYSVHGTQ